MNDHSDNVEPLKYVEGQMGVNPAAGSSIPLVSPPTALTISTDTPFTFAIQVRHTLVQNKSTAPVYIELDATASIGSYLLPPASGGQPSTAWFDIPVTAIHLFSTVATAVNGTVDGNIVLKGFS